MSLTVGTDTYLDLEGAAAYFNDRLHSQAWVAATDPDRERALKTATRLLDTLDYQGVRTSRTQGLAWPRLCIMDPRGSAVPGNTVPTFVSAACAEWGIWLLSHDPAQPVHTVTRKQVGDLNVELAASLPDALPPLVRAYLAPFLSGSQNTAQIVP